MARRFVPLQTIHLGRVESKPRDLGSDRGYRVRPDRSCGHGARRFVVADHVVV